MKKLLRLWVMTKINHSEEYVKGSLSSIGADIKNLNHNQISIYKSTLKSIEADTMIEMAFDKTTTRVKDIDLSFLTTGK